MIMRELKPFLSFGMMGSSGPLQHRRMISVASTGSRPAAHGPENVVDIIRHRCRRPRRRHSGRDRHRRRSGSCQESDPAAAKRAIGKFTQTDDPKVIDEYDFYAPYWVTNLALRPEQFQTWFSYLDEKEYPLAKRAEPKNSYDNSFVESLEKSRFFQRIGPAK
jgi:hypothetical protein